MGRGRPLQLLRGELRHRRRHAEEAGAVPPRRPLRPGNRRNPVRPGRPPERGRARRPVRRPPRPGRQTPRPAAVADLGPRSPEGARVLVHDRHRHAGEDAGEGPRSRGVSDPQDQAGHRPGCRAAADDPRGDGEADPRRCQRRLDRGAGPGDAAAAQGIRCGAAGAAAPARRPRRRGPDHRRPLRRRDDRRRPHPPPQRPGSRRAPAMNDAGRGHGGGRIAEVLLPVPVSHPYRYVVPDALAARAVVGARVVVPVQRRRVIGVVLAVAEGPLDRALKPVADAPDAEPALSPALLELGRWISRYYGAPLGLAVRAVLPGALWGVRRPAGPPERIERVVVLAGSLPSLLERERAFRRAPKRRAVYEALEALGGSAPLRHLRERLQLPASAVDGLVRQGLARYERVARPRDPFADLSSPPPPTLTDDQRRIVSAIATLPTETPALIHGVTGSGKTLVYLEVLRRVVEDGRGAILLVPEIALTPQTVARVRGVFGDRVAVLHSGLSDGERADAWRALRSGERCVAVGARSAIFAPVQRLGAIVVDEEHEASYKQGTAPRYHARDVAAARARLEGARLLL